MGRSPALSTSEPVSLLLQLPPELRLMIYNYLLVSQGPIPDPIHPTTLRKDINHVFIEARSIPMPLMPPAPKKDGDISSSILSTCKTIYSEAWPILYGQNTFLFTHPFWVMDFSAGLTFEEYQKAIRHVELVIDAGNMQLRIGRCVALSRDQTSFRAMETAMMDWQSFFDTWTTLAYSGIEMLCVNFFMFDNARKSINGYRETPAFWDMLTSLELSTMWDHVKQVRVEGLVNEEALIRLMYRGDDLVGRVEFSIAQIMADGYKVDLYRNTPVQAARKGPAHQL